LASSVGAARPSPHPHPLPPSLTGEGRKYLRDPALLSPSSPGEGEWEGMGEEGRGDEDNAKAKVKLTKQS
jgi:hypothetical protein